MIDIDGDWREHVHGKARELIAPSVEWMRSVAEDPDAASVYADAQARLAAEAEGMQRLAVLEIQRQATPAATVSAKVEELKQRKSSAVGHDEATPKGK